MMVPGLCPVGVLLQSGMLHFQIRRYHVERLESLNTNDQEVKAWVETSFPNENNSLKWALSCNYLFSFFFHISFLNAVVIDFKYHA